MAEIHTEPPSPCDTIICETSFGQACSAGTSNNYSRCDHTHGTPTLVPITDITYSTLMTMIAGSSLVPGNNYKITDFATVHYIVDANGTQYSINTGTTEPLIIFATSPNTIDKEAKSALYPQDTIYYDPSPTQWLDDNGFSNSGVIVPGFKGVIYFRHDTLLDNYMGYDFRNVLFRRWNTACPVWTSPSTPVPKGSFVEYSGFVYCAVVDNPPDSPLNADYWVQTLDLSLTVYWNNNPTSTNGIPSGTSHVDVKTFAEGSGTATYELCCRSNHIEPFKDDLTDKFASWSILNNNVFFLQDNHNFSVYSNQIAAESYNNTIGNYFTVNTIGNDFYANMIGSDFNANTIGNYFNANTIGNGFNVNTIGNDFIANTIGNSFNENIIGNYFYGNTIGNNFQNSTIGNDFYSNTIGNEFYGNTTGNEFYSNTIGNDFYGNTTGNNFYNNTTGNDSQNNTIGNNFNNNTTGNDFQSNTTGNDFQNNTIENDFYNNTIENAFNNNTIGNNFNANTVGNAFNTNTIVDGFQFNTIYNVIGSLDFTSATYVYTTYDKTIQLRLDGTATLSYIDNTPVLVFVDATA